MLAAGPVLWPLSARADLPVPVLSALAAARISSDGMAALVVEAGPGGVVRLQHQAEVPFNPASLMKVVTAAAAFDLLGPAYTWATPVYIGGGLQRGRLDGPLIIKGSGDPSLTVERQWLLMQRIRQHGVRLVDGDIVLDRSAFEDTGIDPADFDGEPLRAYNVQPDALMLNFKTVALRLVPDVAAGAALVTMEPPLAGVSVTPSVPMRGEGCGNWRLALRGAFDDPTRLRLGGQYGGGCGALTWQLAYPDPARYNARAIEGLWRETGGRLSGRVREGRAPEGATPAFTFDSPPLAEVVRDMNKFSNNVIAQQIFLTLGLQLRGSGSLPAAREVVQRWLGERAACQAAGQFIDNGSGLSRRTRLSARCLAQVLQLGWNEPWMPELLSSFPVSGVETTARRARGAVGRAHLKTGSLDGVSGFAGVVHADSGRRYIVVGIVNHANAGAARLALDALVRWTLEDGAGAASLATRAPANGEVPARAAADVPTAAPAQGPAPALTLTPSLATPREAMPAASVPAAAAMPQGPQRPLAP
jgi:D-alanyl-D-alanine carboxypeptidase/D-alanyl-D-alanine-endopeptidase (penicillin-binding protein 4)